MSTNRRRKAIERALQQRPSKPLVNGDHMLLIHALRCRCAGCDRLIREWEEEDFTLTARCCGNLYRLRPHSVRVDVEDERTQEEVTPPHGARLPGDLTVEVTLDEHKLPSDVNLVESPSHDDASS